MAICLVSISVTEISRDMVLENILDCGRIMMRMIGPDGCQSSDAELDRISRKRRGCQSCYGIVISFILSAVCIT